jgi:hypothetical protein
VAKAARDRGLPLLVADTDGLRDSNPLALLKAPEQGGQFRVDLSR